jgi:hypothetical protein
MQRGVKVLELQLSLAFLAATHLPSVGIHVRQAAQPPPSLEY